MCVCVCVSVRAALNIDTETEAIGSDVAHGRLRPALNRRPRFASLRMCRSALGQLSQLQSQCPSAVQLMDCAAPASAIMPTRAILRRRPTAPSRIISRALPASI